MNNQIGAITQTSDIQRIVNQNAKKNPPAKAKSAQKPQETPAFEGDTVRFSKPEKENKRNIGTLFEAVFAGTFVGGATAIPVAIGSNLLMKSTVDAGAAMVGGGHMGLAIGLIGGTLTGLITDGLYDNPQPMVGARYGAAIGGVMGALLMQGRLGMATIPTAVAGAIIGGAAGGVSGYIVVKDNNSSLSN